MLTQFQQRHQVLVYDDTVRPDVNLFIDFLKVIPSKQNFRLYDCTIIDWRSPEQKIWLFNNVFMDEQPARFASVFAPIHILFYANLEKQDHFTTYDDYFKEENDAFPKAVHLDIGVALGAICSFALQQGYDPSFLQCSAGPKSANELVDSNKNHFVCSIAIGKALVKTDNVKVSEDIAGKLLLTNKEKLFMPDKWNLDTLPPKFDNKPIQWFKGDKYLANSIECYADAR